MDNRATGSHAKVTKISRWTYALPGETVTDFEVDHRVLVNDASPWELPTEILAQLNRLTGELQQHLNRLNRLNLTTQTFCECVTELQELVNTPVNLWLLRSGQRIFGYALTHQDRHPVLASLIVDHRYRDHGLGKRLLCSMRAALPTQAIKLFCLRTDKRALAFYQSAGGFVDYDHTARFTHLIFLPPLTRLRSPYALPRESDVGSPGEILDQRELCEG